MTRPTGPRADVGHRVTSPPIEQGVDPVVERGDLGRDLGRDLDADPGHGGEGYGWQGDCRRSGREGDGCQDGGQSGAE